MPLRHWTRAEYERLVDAGLFREDPVELIGGQLVVAEPQGSYHATALGAVDDALRAVLPAGWTVRAQMLVALDDESAPEPEPDPSMPYGWRYGWKTTLTPASIVVPLALASVRIAVADLLP